MFVINADSSNTKGFTNTSLSYSDVPINGSYYNMFDSHGNCLCGYTTFTCYFCCQGNCAIIDRSTSSGRNGYCDNASSLIPCGKASNLDMDVIYPCNIFCDICCNVSCSFIANNIIIACFGLCKSISSGNYINMTCNFEIPQQLTYSLVSRRKFDAGICVGKEINGYLGALMIQRPAQSTYQGHYGEFCVEDNYTLMCINIPYFIEMGLLHQDGTTDCFYECIICSKKPVLSAGTVENRCIISYEDNGQKTYGDIYSCQYYAIKDFNINLIYGSINTCGLTTQQGDRIYLRFGNKSASGCIFRHGTNTGSNFVRQSGFVGVSLYGGTAWRYGGYGTGCSDGYYCCTSANFCCCTNVPAWNNNCNAPYCSDACGRSIGLQFSLE